MSEIRQDSCQLCPATVQTLHPGQVVRCFGTTAVAPIVADVLNTHFWFELNSDRDAAAFICRPCWRQVSIFHQFYQSVERLHQISEQQEVAAALASIELPPLDIKDESATAAAEVAVDPLQLCEPEQPATTTGTIVRNLATKQQQENVLIGRYIALDCDLCSEKFQTLVGVQQHHRMRHGNPGYVKCCGRQFRERREVLEHCLWHTFQRKSGPASDKSVTINSKKFVLKRVGVVINPSSDSGPTPAKQALTSSSISTPAAVANTPSTGDSVTFSAQQYQNIMDLLHKQAESRVDDQLADIQEQVMKITRALRTNHRHTAAMQDPDDAPSFACKAYLPFADYASLAAFERTLTDPAVREDLLAYYASIGGESVVKLVSNLLNATYTIELQVAVTWKGKKGKDAKNALERTKLPFIVVEAAWTSFPSNTTSEVLAIFRKYLLHAGDRMRKKTQLQLNETAAASGAPAVEALQAIATTPVARLFSAFTVPDEAPKSCKELLPFADYAQLMAFEQTLAADPAVRKELLAYYTSIGGESVVKMVANLVNATYTLELQVTVTWKGKSKGKEEKYALEATKIPFVIVEAAWNAFPCNTTSAVLVSLRKYLVHACDRMRRKTQLEQSEQEFLAAAIAEADDECGSDEK